MTYKVATRTIRDHANTATTSASSAPDRQLVFLSFKGPEGLTYEYSWNVRLIEDDDAWVPRTFDPKAFGAIDMWGGSSQKPTTQRQILTDDNDADAAAARALTQQPETTRA